MNDDQVRALLLTAALLSGASGSLGFAGGRISAEAPPPEVRLVRLPPRVLRIPTVEAVPADPVTSPLDAPAAPAPVDPPAISEPPNVMPPVPIETAPLPPPRPKVEAKPKPQPKPAPKHEKDASARKPRPVLPAKKPLPTCAAIQREYDAMSWPERMAAYRRASPEEIALGKRCLGF